MPPEDCNAMADAVLQLLNNPGQCQKLGESGSRYVCSHYDRRKIALRFAQLLPSVPGTQIIAAERLST